MFLATLSENRRTGFPVEATKTPCASAATIGELEAMFSEETGTEGSSCNYPLGEAIFLDLYHSLGEDTFKSGIAPTLPERPSRRPHGRVRRNATAYLPPDFRVQNERIRRCRRKSGRGRVAPVRTIAVTCCIVEVLLFPKVSPVLNEPILPVTCR